MPITALPTPPSPADTPADFNTKAFNLLGALPTFVTEANALQTDVNAKQASAATSETNALASKNAAATSETNALASKNAAATSETNAAASATAAAASYDSFDDRYLGPKAAAPTLDNDGNALLTGALYWNTSTALMYVWTGSAWVSSLNPLVVPDNQFRITGSVDATKVAMFEVDGLTTGVTRTYALPDASTTLVGIDVAQTLTNKTFGDNPVFSAGSVNGVPYLSGTKVLTTDAAKLAFDGTNLRVAASIAGGSGGILAVLANVSDTGGDSRYAGLNFTTGSDNGTSSIRSYRTNSAVNYETALAFLTNPVGATQIPVEGMRLTNAGLVIGATSPVNSGKLTVAGAGTTRVSVQAANVAGADAALYLECAGQNSGEILYSRARQALTFLSGGVEGFCLDASRSLLVGTTSTYSSGSRLVVNGNVAQVGIYQGVTTGAWANVVDLSVAFVNGYTAGRVRVYGSENGNVNASYCEYYLLRNSTGWSINTIGTRIALGNTHGAMQVQISGNYLQVTNDAASALGNWAIAFDIFTK